MKSASPGSVGVLAVKKRSVSSTNARHATVRMEAERAIVKVAHNPACTMSVMSTELITAQQAVAAPFPWPMPWDGREFWWCFFPPYDVFDTPNAVLTWWWAFWRVKNMDSRAVYATPCLAMQRNAIRCRMRSKHDLASLEGMLPARTFCRITSMVRRLPSAARIAL